MRKSVLPSYKGEFNARSPISSNHTWFRQKGRPFTSSAAESRLKGYLNKEMNADNGERSVVSAPAVQSL